MFILIKIIISLKNSRFWLFFLNYFAYDIKDSYAKNAKILKKDFDGEIDYEYDNNLLNISHAMYKFTFKIEGEK